MNYIDGKVVLVTGCCGTVGEELVRVLLTDGYQPQRVIGFDNNETGLFYLDQLYLTDPRASFRLGDVRDRERLCQEMAGVDIVLHAAALKHVVLCERTPSEAIRTNVDGVRNVIYAAHHAGVDKVIFTSSDKAVNPTNVMGTSKLMGERLMTSAASEFPGTRTVFASTRFGNVLGSNGSVMPIFARQIAAGGPVTLTHAAMTRFVMTVEQAARLVIESVTIATGGEVFVTKMPVVRISDLAAVMIAELGPQHGYTQGQIGLTEIGCKPGEKLYEELMSAEEIRRVVELPDYFVILPLPGSGCESRGSVDIDSDSLGIHQPYVSSSEPPLDQAELRSFLYTHQLIERDVVRSLPQPSHTPAQPQTAARSQYVHVL